MHNRTMPIMATALAAFSLVLPSHLPHALAQATQSHAAGIVRLTLAPSLSSHYVYWVTIGQRSSEPRPLPAPSGTSRTVSVAVPAGFAEPDAILCVLDVTRSRVARLPMDALLAEAGSSDAPANLLRNPAFARGAENWVYERTQVSAADPIRILSASAGPTGIQAPVVSLNVRAATEQPWHVQFYQNSLDLDEGRAYMLDFWARSDRDRPLSINVNTTAGDAHGLGLTANRIPLTPRWRHISYTFTATRTVPSHSRITFLLGEDTGTVQLAAIRLTPAQAGRTDGTNLFRNGDFRRDRANWALELTAPAAATWALTDQDVPDGAIGRVARINVTVLGKERWHALFAQSGLSLTPAQVYALSFWAKADRARPLTLDSNVDMPDWHPIGLYGGISLTTEWKRWTILFTTQTVVADHSRLVFVLGDDTGRVDLADIRLEARSAEPASVLSPTDFRFTQSVEVPVRYRGKPVSGVTVRAAAPGFSAQMTLQPDDHGVARFADAPLDTVITVTARLGSRSARFERTVPPNGVGTLPEIALPDEWTDVQTVSDAEPESGNPLQGTWESRTSPDGKRYRFTFNEDGTGSVLPATASTDVAPPKRPVVNPFRWYVKKDGTVLVIGTRAYRWSIDVQGDERKLTLRDAKGITRVLYRVR